jgi:hypothetical protein
VFLDPIMQEVSGQKGGQGGDRQQGAAAQAGEPDRGPGLREG